MAPRVTRIFEISFIFREITLEVHEIETTESAYMAFCN